MNWLALRMLTSNTAKYVGIVLGIAFGSLLMGQQASIFCGLLLLTTSQIRDIQGADIWVMDANVQFVDDSKPMSDGALYRVRGVEGVDWAVPLYKGLSRARMPDGNYQQVILLGIDDGSFVGAPSKLFVGKLADLRQPDAVIMDRRGYRRLWPGEPYRVGRTFEMNDHRACLVGVCDALRTFQTFPVVYTRYTQAIRFVPSERKVMSFVLTQPKPGVSAEEVCRRIEAQTGLQALDRDAFFWKTISYYLQRTGIPVNFGITVLLGFLVGTAIAGQTFYLFVVENLRLFGTLRALGTSNRTIVRMIVIQALVGAVLGYGLGIGAAALFGKAIERADRIAFFMPWQVMVGTGCAMLTISVLVSLLSIRRVFALEPAVVFRE